MSSEAEQQHSRLLKTFPTVVLNLYKTENSVGSQKFKDRQTSVTVIVRTKTSDIKGGRVLTKDNLILIAFRF